VLEQQGLTFDVVALLARHLEHVPVIAERFPSLRLVIDHLAKPPIGRDLTLWSDLLTRAAACPNVFAKVSGLYPAQGDRHPWTVDDLRPVFAIALEAFGVDRLMFGSDWPICEVAGGYQRVTRALLELAGDLTDDGRSALRGDTAIHCYGLRLT
jgi:L-fuconolactonase